MADVQRTILDRSALSTFAQDSREGSYDSSDELHVHAGRTSHGNTADSVRGAGNPVADANTRGPGSVRLGTSVLPPA